MFATVAPAVSASSASAELFLPGEVVRIASPSTPRTCIGDPLYDRAAMTQGFRRTYLFATLALLVAAAPRVEQVKLLQGAGEPFDSAALAAARRYAFEPARLTSGEAVPVSITYRLRIVQP